jgi:hypothetical protein
MNTLGDVMRDDTRQSGWNGQNYSNIKDFWWHLPVK